VQQNDRRPGAGFLAGENGVPRLNCERFGHHTGCT
jgi:hypothetical protein